MSEASTLGPTFDQRLRAFRSTRCDETEISEFARAALAEGREEQALPFVRDCAKSFKSALLWQWTGLLERAIDEHQKAMISFAMAAALAPLDISIAHGRARVALEAGVPAEELFKIALRLAPTNGEIFLGYAASKFAQGEALAAEQLLDDVLVRSPLWVQGHQQLAQLRSMMGKKKEASLSLERAIKAQPSAEQLWQALFGLFLQSDQFAELDVAIERGKRSLLRADEALVYYETIAAIEQGHSARADRLIAKAPAAINESLILWRIRHLLRTGRINLASELIDEALGGDVALSVWPYASIAWRLLDDPRSNWLDAGLSSFVFVVDLSNEIGDLGALEQSLRKLHVGKGEYLDQSVRGGSQTDGPLFTNIDPQIRALRAIIQSAAKNYIEKLGPIDKSHPLLGPRRDRRVRFAGSWSVLLKEAGYHSNHVHPEGWISSAFYIHLPVKSATDPANAGWLTLGEPQPELGLDLKPLLEIEPKPGRLILFPSYSWHGTRPFAKGERLTVAFDIRRPE